MKRALRLPFALVNYVNNMHTYVIIPLKSSSRNEDLRLLVTPNLPVLMTVSEDICGINNHGK